MDYKLKENSRSVLKITKKRNEFHLIPNSFKHEKTTSTDKEKYKKTVRISFSWLFWSYYFLLRKPQNKR